MKKIILLILLFLTLFSFWHYRSHPLTAKVKINDAVLQVELAITAQEKERGLGGRRSLEANHGMLFVYDHQELYPFWMKNMRFPLDFIWISDKTVVDLTASVPPPETSQLPIYHPKVPVDKILEINAGEAERIGIKTGDKVDFLN